MRRALSLALFVMIGFAASGVEPPRARADGKWIVVSLSGTMLDDVRVRQRAESGLTATLVILDRSTRNDKPAAARITFRYEPWDEVFLVSVVHADGERERTKVDTIERLRDYLRDTAVRLRPVSERPLDDLALDVRLVPFSSEEAVDAREWFIDTLGSTPKGSSNGGFASVEGVVDVLLATSIQARPVASWSFKVPIHREGDP